MNDEGVVRTAPATPGLLRMLDSLNSNQIWNKAKEISAKLLALNLKNKLDEMGGIKKNLIWSYLFLDLKK